MEAKMEVKKFAVIGTGGKQYKVSEGDVVTIEIIPGKLNEGEKITFDKVLLTDDGAKTNVGTPYLSGATVEGIVEEAGRADKVTVIKYKAKSRYFKKRGHRQPYLKVKITAILVPHLS